MTCAKCGARGYFCAPAAHARQLKIREVHADDQHHDAYRSGEYLECWPHGPADVLSQHGQFRTMERVALRVLPVELTGEACELGLPLRQRRVRRQPADDLHSVAATVRLIGQRPRNEEINPFARREDAGEVERRRQNTDHSGRPVVECQGAADDVGIRGEPSPPEAVTQDHGGRRVRVRATLGI